MEGCSVCTCDESEIPVQWLHENITEPKLTYESSPKTEYGWISSPEPIINSRSAQLSMGNALGRINVSMTRSDTGFDSGLNYLKVLEALTDDGG